MATVSVKTCRVTATGSKKSIKEERITVGVLNGHLQPIPCIIYRKIG